MKIFRNFMLITLCMCLLISVFVSCGNDDAPQSGTENAGSEAQSTEKEVYTGNVIETEPDDTDADTSSGDTGSSGGETGSSQPSDTDPVDEVENNGFTGEGMELPGVTP